MKEFITYLQKKGLSQSTQEAYLFNVEQFFKRYKGEPENTEKKDILKHLEYLKNTKKQQNITRKNSLISLNHYFELLRESEQITINPAGFIKIRGTIKKQLYKIFTFEQSEQLNDDFYNYFIRNFDESRITKNQRKKAFLNRQRNYVMLGFLIYQGLHTNELQKLTLPDTDLNKAKVHIAGTKKSSERTLPLNASQIGSLINYIQNIRPQFFDYRSDETEQLFLPLPPTGGTYTDSLNVMGIIKPLTKQVKIINADFTGFKQIRASVITHWIKNYGLRKAQYTAGHKYIHNTEKYLPNDLESLTDDITKFNPF